MPHRLSPCTLTCSLIDSPHDSEQQTTLASLDPSKPSADRFGRLLRSARARFRSHLRPKKNDKTTVAPQKREFVNFSRPTTMASSRPPQSPAIGPGGHKLNHTSSAASFSRFVEGSMNDRVSAAPPPSYLEDMDVEEYERQFVGTPATEHPPTMERHHTRQTTYTTYTTYEPSAPPHENEQEEQQTPVQPPMGHSRSKSKFLFSPLWDGVREKFSLSRSKSWGGLVSGKDATGRPSLNTQADSRSSIHRGRGSTMTAPCTPAVETPPPVPPVPVFRGAAAALATRDQEAAKEAAKKFSAADYPTKEEVMESYKNLVASGFFEQHAIHGTRHPLRAAQSAGTVLSNSPNRHDSVSLRARAATTASPSRPSPVPSRPESPAEDLKPFAEHLAQKHQNNDEKKLHAIFTGFHRKTASVPVNKSMAPPPLPSPYREEPTRTIGSAFVNDYFHPQTDPVTAPDSPSRGTKRGTDPNGNNIETNVDYGSIRKLAKKLRKSQSKIEFDERPSMPTKPRTSMSSFRSVAASVMFGSKDKGKTRESMESRPTTSAGSKGNFLSEEGAASFFSAPRQANGLDEAMSVATPVRPGQARITKVPKRPASSSSGKGFLGFVRRRNSVSHKSQRGVEEQSTRSHRPSASEAMPMTTNTYVHVNGYQREEDSMDLTRDVDEDDAMTIDSPEPEYQLAPTSERPETPQRPSTGNSTTTPVSIPRFHYPKPTQQPQGSSPLKARPQPNRAPPPVPGYGLGGELVAKERNSGDNGSVSGIVSHRDSGLGEAGEDVENLHRVW
ncbi:hypothetical protein N0V85_000629 [Neurospora sp. IMI 360204]|nr:hypothetical protein N0V85_000629 [Neurospora sp. IMI 360204]